jgi:hypothetical protein
LGDGTSFTTALASDAQNDPGYRLFIQPYLPARTGSYLAGELNLAPLPDLEGRRSVASATLIWAKAPDYLPLSSVLRSLPDVSYPLGFEPVSVSFGMDPWQAPTTAIWSNPAVTLAQRLGLTSAEFEAFYSPTGSAAYDKLPSKLALSDRNVVRILLPISAPPNSTKWNISLAPRTGTFSGSFELIDNGRKRPVPFSGVLRQAPSTSNDGVIGAGHYRMHRYPGSNEHISGQVRFQKPENR